MKEVEIAKLKAAFLEGGVYWMGGDAPLRIIGFASPADEDCLCAYLEGPGGRYVALDNCELSDFAKITPLA